MATADDFLEETLTIGQLAERTGVPASTIRYYERRGLIPHPSEREDGGGTSEAPSSRWR